MAALANLLAVDEEAVGVRLSVADPRLLRGFFQAYVIDDYVTPRVPSNHAARKEFERGSPCMIESIEARTGRASLPYLVAPMAMLITLQS